MKGAPEVILERCSHILHENNTQIMTPEMLNMCNAACLDFAEMGERVLGFCDYKMEPRYTKDFPFSTEPANFPQRGLRFLGLIALIDPPRPQVPDAIRKCKSAGIKVAMVTGDHPVRHYLLFSFSNVCLGHGQGDRPQSRNHHRLDHPPVHDDELCQKIRNDY
jgi:sodium/potassium-transporting ATPase subunit alpha